MRFCARFFIARAVCRRVSDLPRFFFQSTLRSSRLCGTARAAEVYPRGMPHRQSLTEPAARLRRVLALPVSQHLLSYVVFHPQFPTPTFHINPHTLFQRLIWSRVRG